MAILRLSFDVGNVPVTGDSLPAAVPYTLLLQLVDGEEAEILCRKRR